MDQNQYPSQPEQPTIPPQQYPSSPQQPQWQRNPSVGSVRPPVRGEPMNLKRWWETASDRARGAFVLVGVLFLCGCCGLFAIAANGGSKSTTQAQGGDTATTQQATNTAGPTATPKPTATATATPKPKAWTTTFHKDGTASRQTETFHVSGQWKIVWSCQKSNDFGGNFAIEMYDSSGGLVDLVANTQDNDHGEWNGHQNGDFYLKVDTYGENWSIDVQQYQ